jgi:hypothetical protein
VQPVKLSIVSLITSSYYLLPFILFQSHLNTLTTGFTAVNLTAFTSAVKKGTIVPINPHFLDLGTSLKWVVSFTPWPLYWQRKSPRYSLYRRLGEPQSRSGRRGEEKVRRWGVMKQTHTHTRRLRYVGLALYSWNWAKWVAAWWASLCISYKLHEAKLENKNI